MREESLARTGATVGMACRNQEKAALAKDEIMEEYPDAKIEVMKLDTSSLATVSEFAKSLKEKYDRLDWLVRIG